MTRRRRREPAGAAPGNRLTRVLDWLSEQSGVFVALWTVNAVCAYFFEVVARYIFNAPTIWVHQASFLMFGMQYLLAGAFAYLHGDHVRVDVLYVKFPKRGPGRAGRVHLHLLLHLRAGPAGQFLALFHGRRQHVRGNRGNVARAVVSRQGRDGPGCRAARPGRPVESC